MGYIDATVRARGDGEGYLRASTSYMSARHCTTDRNAIVERDEERIRVSDKFVGEHAQMSGRQRR